MDALNGFTNAHLQIVPGRNAMFAPRPLDWPDCYGFNPDQVLILDKAVAEAVSEHRAHEEFQRWHAAAGERRARIRRKGRWGGSDLQMSVVPPDGKDILNLRKIANCFLITLDHERGEYILSYGNCPILVPTAYRAQKFAYDCYPIPPLELTMVHWKFARQIWM